MIRHPDERVLDTPIAVLRELVELDDVVRRSQTALTTAQREEHGRRTAAAWEAARKVVAWRADLLKGYGRMGDMAPPGRTHMTVLLDSDADACLEIWDQETYSFGARAGIEFCTRVGGGTSTRTRDALIQLARAIELDNQDDPRKRWPPERTNPHFPEAA